jgi:hypothetical protein
MTTIFNKYRKATQTVFCVAVCVAGLTSCNYTDTPSSPLRQMTIEVMGDATEASRVSISGNKMDGYTALWNVTDQIGVSLISEGVELISNEPLTAKTVDSEGVASFSAAVSSAWTGRGVLYSYYPYKANGLSQKANVILGEVPAEQFMTEDGSFDTSAAYMVGQPVEVELTSGSKLQTTTKFRFLNCFVNLLYKGISVEGVSSEDVVTAVRMRVDNKCLAGDFELNLESGASDFKTISNEVVVAVPANMTLGELSAWLVVAPFELTPSDQMVVEVETADYIISKCITGRTINFGMRQVITLNLSIDENCDIISKESTPQSVTYNILDQSTSADAPFDFQYEGDVAGKVSQYDAAILTICGCEKYSITDIVLNVKAGKSSSKAQYSIEFNDKKYSNIISKYSTTAYTPLALLDAPIPLGTDSITITFYSQSGAWYLESLTLTY